MKPRPSEYAWVLDANSCRVFSIEIPESYNIHERYPTESYERFIVSVLPTDVGLSDCQWMIGDSKIHRPYRGEILEINTVKSLDAQNERKESDE